jgi:PLP dependent protein
VTVPDRRGAFGDLRADRVRDNLERVRERIAASGRDAASVEVCAAVKYVALEELPVLAEAGVELVGENRAQDLAAAQDRHGVDLFAWDFIGALQSRKVRDVAPRARLIHSLASESALRKLEQHPAREVLVEVNVAGEEGKAGIAVADLDDFIGRCPVPVTGLMTMPPLAERPEDSRPHFARLADLASERSLERLSMGTTQDFEVAVAEGATIVRLGTVLYE